MTEPEHRCENCRRVHFGEDGEPECVVGHAFGRDVYDSCSDSRTCPEWEAQ
jgi:hypothetical protein